jgi:biotin carboxyl carrier protein
MDVRSPGVGRVLRVEVTVGPRVARGQELMVIESMKVEIPIKAPVAGHIKEIHAGAGDHVQRNRVLIKIE